jgi:hypothetical protein
MSAIRKLNWLGGSGQRPTRAGVGPRDQPREKREIDRHPRGELAVATVGAVTAERTRHHHGQRAARSHDPCRSSRSRLRLRRSEVAALTFVYINTRDGR